MSTILKIKSGSTNLVLTLEVDKYKNFKLTMEDFTVCRGFVSVNCKHGDVEYFWNGASIVRGVIFDFINKNVYKEYLKKIK